jgi:hypothetical protein
MTRESLALLSASHAVVDFSRREMTAARLYGSPAPLLRGDVIEAYHAMAAVSPSSWFP